MIKTLRITGVAAVAFAGVVLASVLGPVSLIHLDNRGNQQMAKILDAPSAVERFQKQHAGSSRSNQDSKPPLVKQAEDFKDIIDPKLAPPVASTAKPVPPARLSTSLKPQTTTPKFTLIGTSYSPSNPGSSLAYISVDNTYKWVQCGSEVGHLIIKEVREGSIVCWDGTRESELAMEPVPSRVSLEVDDLASVPDAAAPQPVEVKIAEDSAGQPAPSQVQAAVPRMTDDEHEALGDLVERLKTLQNLPGDGPATAAERKAAADRLISEFKSSRVSPQETRKLEGLGSETGSDIERAREEQKRELLRRLNAARSSRN